MTKEEAVAKVLRRFSIGYRYDERCSRCALGGDDEESGADCKRLTAALNTSEGAWPRARPCTLPELIARDRKLLDASFLAEDQRLGITGPKGYDHPCAHLVLRAPHVSLGEIE